jgi:hypothetical protein
MKVDQNWSGYERCRCGFQSREAARKKLIRRPVPTLLSPGASPAEFGSFAQYRRGMSGIDPWDLRVEELKIA